MQERELTAQETSEFKSCAEGGAKLLGLSGATPQATVEAIESYILEWHKPKGGFFAKILARKPSSTDAALALGALWGDQIVRQLKWRWVCLQSDGQDLYAVVSPDKSLAMFPTYFVNSCLANSGADCTIVLAFNMLTSGTPPKAAPGGYQNLMSGVRRIVPR